jgi:hypothetical protein
MRALAVPKGYIAFELIFVPARTIKRHPHHLETQGKVFGTFIIPTSTSCAYMMILLLLFLQKQSLAPLPGARGERNTYT